MSSIQTLQYQHAALEKEYQVTASKLAALRQKKGYETDVSEQFKLEQQIEETSTTLERLGQQLEQLEQAIQAIATSQPRAQTPVPAVDQLSSSEKTPLLKSPLIALAAIGAVGLGILVTGIFANPRSNTSSNPVAQTTEPSSIGLDRRFAGNWTSEFDVSATHTVNLQIKIEGDQTNELSAAMEAFSRQGEASSGGLSLTGQGKGDAAKVIIYDSRAHAIGNAELRLERENLVWRLTAGDKESLPTLTTLYRIDEGSPASPSP